MRRISVAATLALLLPACSVAEVDEASAIERSQSEDRLREALGERLGETSAELGRSPASESVSAGECRLKLLPVGEGAMVVGMAVLNPAELVPCLGTGLREGDVVMLPGGPIAGRDLLTPTTLDSFGKLFEASEDGSVTWRVRSADGTLRDVVVAPPDPEAVAVEFDLATMLRQALEESSGG